MSSYRSAADSCRPPADLILQRFDANQDGTLSEVEVPPRMWFRLRQADANGDGRVTREEYREAVLRVSGK